MILLNDYIISGTRRPKVATTDPHLRTTCECHFDRRSIDETSLGRASVLTVVSTVERPDKNVTIRSERFVEVADESGRPRLHEMLSVQVCERFLSCLNVFQN